MVSRTTDDYRAMAMSGCVAVTEPAFWAGYDRPGAVAFVDYFDRLVDFEPKRAAQYGIAHHTWMCLNPKEAEDRALTREILKLIPAYLERPTVLGIGEIGLNRVTRNERRCSRRVLKVSPRCEGRNHGPSTLDRNRSGPHHARPAARPARRASDTQSSLTPVNRCG